MRNGSEHQVDDIDLGILAALQENCRLSMAKIGERVGLSAAAVNERVHKLEEAGDVRGYHASIDTERLGFDVTAFIGVTIAHERVDAFEKSLESIEDILECHHVTGSYTLLLKVKTRNTGSLETLISRLRASKGVDRTETTVVLSTHIERDRAPSDGAVAARRPKRGEAA